jgi:hypothetical protein
MKIKIEGSIYFDPTHFKYGGEIMPKWRFCNSKEPNFCDYVLVVPHTVEAEVPDDFDPRPGMVEALHQQRKEAERAFADRVMEIDRQINNLLSIENSAVPA